MNQDIYSESWDEGPDAGQAGMPTYSLSCPLHRRYALPRVACRYPAKAKTRTFVRKSNLAAERRMDKTDREDDKWLRSLHETMPDPRGDAYSEDVSTDSPRCPSCNNLYFPMHQWTVKSAREAICTTIGEAEKSASTGCSVCMLVVNVIKDLSLVEELQKRTSDAKALSISDAQMYMDKEERKQHEKRIKRRYAMPNRRKVEITIIIDEKNTGHLLQVHSKKRKIPGQAVSLYQALGIRFMCRCILKC